MSGEQKLTVREILERPHFCEAKVIAGSKGLDRFVEWVHILELDHDSLFINGNELILTPNIFFNNNRNPYLTYLEELIEQKATALCIAAGQDTIPDDVLEFAEKNSFPLIVVEKTVKFVDITMDLHTLIVNRQAKALLELESFSKELSNLSLQSKSINHILQAFHRLLSAQIIYYPVTGSPICFPQIKQPEHQQYLKQLSDHFNNNSITATYGLQISLGTKRNIFYQPIVTMGQVLAYVGVVLDKRDTDDFLIRSLDYTATAIAHSLLRQLFLEERNLENQALLLDDLLNNRIQSEELMRTKLGIFSNDTHNFSYYCGVIQWGIPKSNLHYEERDSLLQGLSIVTRTVISRNFLHPIILTMGNRLYFLIYQAQAEHKNLLPIQERIKTTVNQIRDSLSTLLKDGRFLIGMSKPKHMLTHGYEAFQEAKQVIEVAQITEPATNPFYENIGVFRVLLNMKDNQTIHSLIQDYLGKVLQHDQQYGAELLKTLRTYLNNNGSKQDTAKQLYIHRQTVNYRIEKLKELLGDFMNPDHRICIEIALRAYDLHRIHFF
ncbi:PucR family transcriptional regulator [Bacillus badius]|uniref:Transcriptional regulator n=1 Tax=Bacillus badius TaxID=1455 RepID=A0ABR5AY18_BACBA|nr:PucR family transcriptional regulator [Bacillus badius]KIL74757.1 transcriptional regulator [Bacillus badius]KIL79113.1 transcriptional regulator [Bacillus badius]MED4715463.1 PucR family transcriptional regulator ligand-binding domain-containing protein [Bacillus badius]